MMNCSFLPKAVLTLGFVSNAAAIGASFAHAQEQKVEEQEPTEPPIDPEGGGAQSASSSGGASWVNTAAPPFYEISGHTGGFTTGLPILVPSFRGLEPSLSLSYNSSGRNGFAGVGWDVSGIDLIERRNKDGGWPRFDSTDTYWWRGQKLVPCGASGSPGCDAGGTHFTESETYVRIVDNGDDTWTVTGETAPSRPIRSWATQEPRNSGTG